MKTLILIRHAKSDWSRATAGDFERPLNARGLRDAPKMGKRLLQGSWLVDTLISSTARRAEQTALLLARAMDYPERNILWKNELYLAGPDAMLHTIRATDDHCQTLALVGHNPGITLLANRLGSETPLTNVPTCGVVILQFNIENWDKLDLPGHRRLFDIPGNISPSPQNQQP